MQKTESVKHRDYLSMNGANIRFIELTTNENVHDALSNRERRGIKSFEKHRIFRSFSQPRSLLSLSLVAHKINFQLDRNYVFHVIIAKLVICPLATTGLRGVGGKCK